MSDAEPFDRAHIIELLSELGDALDDRGIRAEMFVVGGAAMALAYNTRRATRDIDAVFEPKAVVYEVARTIAARHNLPDMWLNDAVKGLLPGPDLAPQEITEIRGLRVTVPSPEYLLALKVAAARVDRDADDIRILAAACGLRSAKEIFDHTVRIVGHSRFLEPKVQFLIEEMF